MCMKDCTNCNELSPEVKILLGQDQTPTSQQSGKFSIEQIGTTVGNTLGGLIGGITKPLQQTTTTTTVQQPDNKSTATDEQKKNAIFVAVAIALVLAMTIGIIFLKKK